MTVSANAKSSTLTLQPYVFFYGRCEEALEFYKTAIGGSYELMRNEGSPAEQHVPADFAKKIMHASFTGSGISFLCSDGRQSKKIDPDEGNISLALSAVDRADADRVFKALAEGGSIQMPLGDAFWGGRFGSLIDRFGIEWMITSP